MKWRTWEFSQKRAHPYQCLRSVTMISHFDWKILLMLFWKMVCSHYNLNQTLHYSVVAWRVCDFDLFQQKWGSRKIRVYIALHWTMHFHEIHEKHVLVRHGENYRSSLCIPKMKKKLITEIVSDTKASSAFIRKCHKCDFLSIGFDLTQL